jgi:hypothetical protein
MNMLSTSTGKFFSRYLIHVSIWQLVYSINGCGINIILLLNIQQECVHFLIAVEKMVYFYTSSSERLGDFKL